MPTKRLRQFGPVRDGKRLEAALSELEVAARLRIVQDGRRKTIAVNPALVGEAR